MVVMMMMMMAAATIPWKNPRITYHSLIFISFCVSNFYDRSALLIKYKKKNRFRLLLRYGKTWE